MMQYLSSDEIAYLHARIVTVTGGVPGVRDVPGFQSIATRLRMTYKGQEFYNDLYAKAAILMALIVENKPFHDGNKRAGIAASAIFLRLNGQELLATDHEIVDFCRAVDRGSMSLEIMRNWFRTHTTQLAAAAG